MSIFAWIAVGLAAGWIVQNIAERRRNLLIDLVTGVAGALGGGFLFSYVLDFRYAAEPNLSSIAAAALGAIIFVATSRGFDTRRM